MMIINQKLLSDIELIAFDFDGVFTDNSVYVNQDGKESVKCWRGDGLGLDRLKKLGVKLCIISTEINPVVSMRANKLAIDCYQAVENKADILVSICDKHSISLKNTMFVGNDINDIPAFQIAGIPVGVADACKEIYSYVMFRTMNSGGAGAVREICDMVLNAKNELI
jgi:3-deoxy-D-manno-octulosonate 8-phosphate phosphatase (KDO 8-P phosphatase)